MSEAFKPIGESLVARAQREMKENIESARAMLDAATAMRCDEHIATDVFVRGPQKVEALAVLAEHMCRARVDLGRMGANFHSPTTGTLTQGGKRFHFFIATEEKHLEGKRFVAVLRLGNVNWRMRDMADRIVAACVDLAETDGMPDNRRNGGKHGEET